MKEFSGGFRRGGGGGGGVTKNKKEQFNTCSRTTAKLLRFDIIQTNKSIINFLLLIDFIMYKV